MPSQLVQQVFTISKMIYDQVKLVKINRSQCQLLAKRVLAIETAITKLPKTSKQDAYSEFLLRLKICLEEALDYMKTLSDEKWYWQFIKAKDHQERFDDFNQRLAEAINELNLGLSTQGLLNHEESVKARKEDILEIKASHQKILQLNQTMLKEMKQLVDPEFMQRQTESLKASLQKMMDEKGGKKESRLETRVKIPYYELFLEKKIGVGSFGDIYQGQWHDMPVTIKLWNSNLSAAEEKLFFREVRNLQHLVTPRYIPHFYGACLENGQACLVMEYFPLGSLYDYLHTHRLAPDQKHQLALSLAKSIQFLHQKKVMHRNLNSKNVLLAEDNKNLIAKITDFGLSKGQYSSAGSITHSSLLSQNTTTWTAPEVLEGQEATYKSDIFSTGMILWEIFTGERLESTLVDEKWREAEKRKLDNKIPKQYADLIIQCWSINSHERPPSDVIVTRLETIPAIDKEKKYEFEQKKLSPAVSSFELLPGRSSISLSSTKDFHTLSSAETAYAEAKECHRLFKLSGYKNKENYDSAIKWYQIALKNGNSNAEKYLGDLFARHGENREEKAKGLQLLEKSAKLTSDSKLLDKLSETYQRPGIFHNPKKAAELRELAKQMTSLGLTSFVELST